MDEKEKNRYCKFGNNYFELSTNGVDLNGVLLELPSFSFSTRWEESPATSMGDEIYKLINKPEIEFLAANTQNAKIMRRTGNITSKVYENAEPISFELKFRCYPGQAFGDDYGLSTAGDWITGLSRTTSISADLRFGVGRIIATMSAAAEGGKNQIFGIVDDVKKLASGEYAGISDMMLKRDDKAKELEKIEQAIQEQLPKEPASGRGSILGTRTMQELRAKRASLNKEIRELKDKINVNNINDKFNKIKTDYDANGDRVSTSVNNFGAHLFKLSLYPFIFKKPFIVYINSWTMKPSKEFNIKEDTNFYYDFTISCTADRVLSATTWNDEYLY